MACDIYDHFCKIGYGKQVSLTSTFSYFINFEIFDQNFILDIRDVIVLGYCSYIYLTVIVS